MNAPPFTLELARRVAARGGRALLVGGPVRDHLLHRPVNDWDVEVFGLPEDKLVEVLRGLGRVNAVGRSFGVYKIQSKGSEYDVSMPRRDSKIGAGHRGIHVEGDPDMSPKEAARRRDLTINAMMCDPLTGEVIDPWGGRDDLAARRLRAVDDDTFLEDPLRALRVAQFAARLGFTADPALVALCRTAALHELPAERIQGEWVKLLLKGVQPSRGMRFAREAEILSRVFPEVVDDPATDAMLDRLTLPRAGLGPEGRQLAAMLLCWLHRTPIADAERTLDRLWIHRVGSYAARERILAALPHLGATPPDARALRTLSTQAEVWLTLTVRGAVFEDPEIPDAIDRAIALGVLTDPPEALLKGRDVTSLGVTPGPAMGQLLKALYALQIDGTVATREQALEQAKVRIAAQAVVDRDATG
jgi:tRNA nucleotidyltransferase (CCA-adding enzyme)